MSFMPSMIPGAAAGGAQLIAGVSGVSTGYTEGVFGSYNPRELFGELVRTLSTAVFAPDIVTFETEDPNVTENFWETITISGVFSGGQKTLIWNRIADAFTYQANIGGRTRWQSTVALGVNELMVDGNAYQVIIIDTLPVQPGEQLILIAGDVLPFRGYDDTIAMGVLTPKVFNGRTVGFIRNDNQVPDFLIGFNVAEGVVPNIDSSWIQMTLDGEFGVGNVQQVYPRTAGAYLAGPPSLWTYGPDNVMIDGRTYTTTWT